MEELCATARWLGEISIKGRWGSLTLLVVIKLCGPIIIYDTGSRTRSVAAFMSRVRVIVILMISDRFRGTGNRGSGTWDPGPWIRVPGTGPWILGKWAGEPWDWPKIQVRWGSYIRWNACPACRAWPAWPALPGLPAWLTVLTDWLLDGWLDWTDCWTDLDLADWLDWPVRHRSYT